MKIPKFKSEAEEADWLYAHRKQIEAEIRRAQPRKTLSVQEIVDRETTRAISIRLPIADIDRAKQRAKARGIGYQTLIRMVIHESLAANAKKTGETGRRGQ